MKNFLKDPIMLSEKVCPMIMKVFVFFLAGGEPYTVEQLLTALLLEILALLPWL